MDHVNVSAEFDVRGFTVPEIIGVPPKLGSHWIRLRSLFSKFVHGFLLGWTLKMNLPNMKSVTLPVYEIIVIEVWGVG